MPRITFVNHASVLLTEGPVGILTDPWYEGAAFNRGWALMVETPPETVEALLAHTSHIWLSHEHPDHFSPAFFRRHGATLRARGIPVLFQKTADGRVAAFLRGQGLTVTEMPEGRWVTLGPGVRARIARADFYDSALLLEMGGLRIANLNDCPVTAPAEVAAFARRWGPADVLLTQFSYAAWKGGPDNRAWRLAAAAEKIAGMRRQAAALGARTVIPFASFVRFAHRDNLYLNDAANWPADVHAADPPVAANVVVMAPGETQDLAALAQDPASLAFWEGVRARLPEAEAFAYDPVAPEALAAGFAAWHRRVMAQNAGWAIRALAATGLAGAFRPVNVRLTDAGRTLRVDLARGRLDATAEAPHVAMHSAALAFVFAHDFGFDTLTVNGCFLEEAPGGFVRMAKCFGIGTLNAMGLRLGPGLVLDARFVALALARLSAVGRRLAARPAA